MRNYLERDDILSTSKTDFRGELRLSGLFDLFMDLAAEHAETVGVGYADMLSHRAFWLAVRTRVRIFQMPRYMDQVRARTWPAQPGNVKCDRFYRLTRDGETVAEGRTEWVAQNVDTGRIMKPEEYGYPVDMTPLPERVCDGPFTRFREKPDPANLWAEYTVTSRDIDTGRHMNNVAYVRMLLGAFPVAELEEMDIAEAEISYSAACREGERLRIYRRGDEEGWHMLVQKPDGSTAAQMVLRVR